MKYQVGIDEAGRGPVLGSLFMAGIKIAENQLSILQDLNVMDSKSFGSNQTGKKKEQKSAQLSKRNLILLFLK